MRKRHLIAAVAGAILLAACGYLWSQGEVITLRAEIVLPIGRSPVEPATGDALVAILAPGDSAEVVECLPVKSDATIAVRWRDGRVGYVSVGPQFVLEREGLSVARLLSSVNRIIFSCHGMYGLRSVQAEAAKPS